MQDNLVTTASEEQLGYDSLWNSHLADTATARGEDIDGFIDHLPSNQKQIGMRALHDCDCSVERASALLPRLVSDDPELKPWTDEEKVTFNQSIIESNMYMMVVSAKVGRSVNSCLV